MSILDKLLNTDPEAAKIRKEEKEARLKQRQDRVKQRHEEIRKRREELRKERQEKLVNRKSTTKTAHVEEQVEEEDIVDIKEELVQEESDIEEVKYIRPRTRR